MNTDYSKLFLNEIEEFPVSLNTSIAIKISSTRLDLYENFLDKNLLENP